MDENNFIYLLYEIAKESPSLVCIWELKLLVIS